MMPAPEELENGGHGTDVDKLRVELRAAGDDKEPLDLSGQVYLAIHEPLRVVPVLHTHLRVGLELQWPARYCQMVRGDDVRRRHEV